MTRLLGVTAVAIVLAASSTLAHGGPGPADVARIDVASSTWVVAPGTTIEIRGVVRDARGAAVANAPLGVEDGVVRMSRAVPIAAEGQFAYRVTPRVSAFYVVAFVSGRVRTSVTIAAATSDRRVRAVSGPIPMGPTVGGPPPALAGSALYCSAAGRTGRVTGQMTAVETEFWRQTVAENTKAGPAIVYVGTVAICAFSALVPVAAPACVAGIDMSIATFALTELGAIAKTIVTFVARDEAERNRWNAAVDAGKVLFSIFSAGEATSVSVEALKTLANALAAHDAVSRMVTASAPGTESVIVSVLGGAAKGLEVVVSVAK